MGHLQPYNLHRSGRCHVLVFDDEYQVLVQDYQDYEGQHRLALPSGVIRKGELPPQAAVRIVAELCALYVHTPLVYLNRDQRSCTVLVRTQKSECPDWKWVSVQELLKSSTDEPYRQILMGHQPSTFYADSSPPS
jgi:ADP-ribose pyrophosphatase YjhB (NUDIX family)